MDNLHRIEKDFLGEKEIENDKYYGIQTLRAKENFNIPKFYNLISKSKKSLCFNKF